MGENRKDIVNFNEAHFELEEYNSEDEGAKSKSTTFFSHEQGLSSMSLQLMEKSATPIIDKTSPFARLIRYIG